MNGAVLTAAFACMLAVGCGASRSSVVSLDGMRARGATFGASGFAVVVSWDGEVGANYVLNEPYVDGDRVVLGVLGMVSSGAGGRRTECVSLAGLALPDDWEHRLHWRAPDGTLTPIDDVGRAEACPY